MQDHPFRVMAIVAHQDDFEFTAAGTFALLRETLGAGVALKIVCTTRGASGHHQLSTETTFRRREAEATRSAAMIGADYECLTLLDGGHLPGQMNLDRETLGGLWNVIRGFEADVVFCPPVVTDPLAGVHIDHLRTAWAVRLIAYQIVVPNAYPTLNAPRKDYVPSPLIINLNDRYTAETGDDVIRQDITRTFDTKLRMSLCHASQIFEWLPFAAGEPPPTPAQWPERLRQRHTNLNRLCGCDDGIMSEYFQVTRWGRPPRAGELERLFPARLASRME